MNKTLPKICIYDIDGVVVNSQDRYLRSGGTQAMAEKDYNAFRQCLANYNKDTEGDIPLYQSIEILNNLRQTMKIEHMVAITARGEEGKGPTLKFLKEHMPWEVNESLLYMRPSYPEITPGVFWQPGMPKFSSIDYKRKIALELMTKYDILFAVDDHVDIVEMYWELGIYSMCMLVPGVNQETRKKKVNVIQG